MDTSVSASVFACACACTCLCACLWSACPIPTLSNVTPTKIIAVNHVARDLSGLADRLSPYPVNFVHHCRLLGSCLPLIGDANRPRSCNAY